MNLDMAIVMRPRYHGMPDPIETANDSDTSKAAAIRFVDFRGDYDTYFEIKVIGPYPDDAARNRDLARLRDLPLGDPDLNGTAQFFADRIGSMPADETVEPTQIADAATLRQFFAYWDGCDEAEYYQDPEAEPEPCAERQSQQFGLF